MASEPKKFDAVTIVGVGLAVAIMFFGARNSSQQPAAQSPPPAQAQTTLVQGTPGQPQPQPPASDKVKDAPVTPDIAVANKFIDFTFSSQGATLKSARLTDQFEDPSKKNKKGLDLLGEIEPGKHAFGIPHFEIKTKDSLLVFDGKAAKSLDQFVWAMTKDTGTFDANGNRAITYELPVDNYIVSKTYSVNNEQHFVSCQLKIENKSDKDSECMYWINGPQGILLDILVPEPKGAAAHSQIEAELAEREIVAAGSTPPVPTKVGVSATSAKSQSEEGRYVGRQGYERIWGAVKNRFYMASIVSLNPAQLVVIVANSIEAKDHPDPRFSEPNIALVGRRNTFQLNKNAVQLDPYALYLGPADDTNVEAAESAMHPPGPYHMRLAIQYIPWRWMANWFDWVARYMMWLFNNLYKLFGSFGVAVALMTIIIKLCIHPLQRKMMVSMSKMQKLQPEMKKITEKYKNAKGTEAKLKMSQEQRHLMQQHGASPAGGCLPMLIQMPIFMALYGIFNHAFEMRGAEFLWIKDLSQPDRLMPLSFWPYSINLLPILYSVLSIIQTQFMTPQQKSDDPQQEMNRKMMKWFPLMISLMFYSMPAGLVLYFAVSACWGMMESWYIKKFIIKDPPGPGAVLAGTGSSKPIPALAK